MILPPAFLERIRRNLPDAEAFLTALEHPPITSLRLNPSKPSHLPFETTPVPWHPDGRYLLQRPSFVADPRFHAGAYYVQEASSMLLYALLDLHEPVRILDMCAAPGGKSTLLASAMPAGSVLVSNEVVPARTNILTENMRRWGNSNVIVTKREAQAFVRVPNFFDVVLVDAPCSGEGMFRKDETSVSQWSQDLIDSCALRQQDIVSSLLPALRPGGTLIYATCTYAPEENEQMVDWLLDTYELEPHPLEPLQGKMLEQTGVTPVTIHGSQHAAFRCFPHRVKGEGMFFCRLKKLGDRPAMSFSVPKTPTLPRAATTFLRDFVRDDVHVVLEKNHLYYQPAGLPDLMDAKLATPASALKLGKLHGKGARQGVTPSHELALSTLLRDDVASVHLDEATALRYLQKEDLTAQDIKNPARVEQGWVVARFEGLALGWLKATKGRFNNALPLNWRIRKVLE